MPSSTANASMGSWQRIERLRARREPATGAERTDWDEATVPGSARAASFFSLSDKARSALSSVCREVFLTGGQTLFSQGTRHTSSYIIKDGLIRTYYTAHSGREVTLAFWPEGDLVGGPDFFGGGCHIWSGQAARNSVVMAVKDIDLSQQAKNHPEILYWINDTLSYKLRWLSILFQIHGTETVLHRLAKLLLILSDTYGEEQLGGVVIRHKISQSDLSTLIGASRQWTNKTLNELQDRGLLRLKKRQIQIVNREGLRSLSEA